MSLLTMKQVLDFSTITKKRKHQQQQQQQKVITRKWTPKGEYTLCRKGIPLKVSPDQMFNELSVAHLYIFKHDCVEFGEDESLPKWMGVFKIINAQQQYQENEYYTPKQEHYHKIYAKTRQATSFTRTLCEDGTPYWVDAWWHKKQRERLAKKRCQEKKKKKKLKQ